MTLLDARQTHAAVFFPDCDLPDLLLTKPAGKHECYEKKRNNEAASLAKEACKSSKCPPCKWTEYCQIIDMHQHMPHHGWFRLWHRLGLSTFFGLALPELHKAEPTL